MNREHIAMINHAIHIAPRHILITMIEALAELAVELPNNPELRADMPESPDHLKAYVISVIARKLVLAMMGETDTPEPPMSRADKEKALNEFEALLSRIKE